MKYHIANPTEDLGTHSLKRLREAFATEEAAQGVSVEEDGQWHALWPWLQKQPTGLFSRNITTPAKADVAAEHGFRPPFIVSALRVLSCVILACGLLSLFGPWPMLWQCAISGIALWISFTVIEMIARIEYNTRAPRE